MQKKFRFDLTQVTSTCKVILNSPPQGRPYWHIPLLRKANPQMARVLTAYKFRTVGSHRKRLYPWDEWTDGRTWKATSGKDFATPAESFRTTLHSHARRNGLAVRSEVIVEGSGPTRRTHVVFQFESASTKVTRPAKATDSTNTSKGRTPRARSTRRINAVCEAYQSGLSLKEVGTKYGMHPTQVRQVLVANGIERRAKGSGPSPARATAIATRNAAILEAYANGETANTIAERYGIGDATVYNIVKQAGYTRRMSHPKRSLLEQRIVTDYKKGLTLREVADKHGVNREKVRRILIDHNVTRRPNPVIAQPRKG
jgi:hypothetical protein